MGDSGGADPAAKRRRIAIACDKCRSRKIRCDTALPKCTPCALRGYDCIVTGPSTTAPVYSRTVSSTQAPEDARPAISRTPSAQPLDKSPSVFDEDECAISLHSSAGTTRLPPTRVTRNGIEREAASSRVNETGLLHDHGEERPKFLGSSSSQVYVKWLDQEQPGQKLAAHFGHAAGSVEEVAFPGLTVARVDLPNEWLRFVSAYFDKVHPYYPIIDRSAFNLAHTDGSAPSESTTGVDRVLLYLVVSLGADSSTGSRALSQAGTDLFAAAWQSLPVLLGAVDRRAAQCLILLSLACRSRNKDGAAWYLLGYAVRICQGLGMHLGGTTPTSTGNLDARIWYVLYSLDKIESFSSGRPSAIRESDCTIREHALLVNPPPELHRTGLESFVAFVRLCRVIAHVQETLFSVGKAEMSAVDALTRIGQCDEAICRWRNELPLDLRPTNESPNRGPLFVWAGMIHMIYHQIMITLHRLSLFDDSRLVRPNLSQPSVLPYSDRLSGSASICASSARAILNLFDDLLRFDRSSRMFTQDLITLAIFVLSIHTYRHPTRWQARADLSLLELACQRCVADFKAAGFHPDFYALIPKLFHMVESRVLSAASSAPVTRATSPIADPTAASNVANKSRSPPVLQDDLEPPADDFESPQVSIDALWSNFFGPGGQSAWHDAFELTNEESDLLASLGGSMVPQE